jgi:hypothetical protein
MDWGDLDRSTPSASLTPHRPSFGDLLLGFELEFSYNVEKLFGFFRTSSCGQGYKSFFLCH